MAGLKRRSFCSVNNYESEHDDNLWYIVSLTSRYVLRTPQFVKVKNVYNDTYLTTKLENITLGKSKTQETGNDGDTNMMDRKHRTDHGNTSSNNKKHKTDTTAQEQYPEDGSDTDMTAHEHRTDQKNASSIKKFRST